MSKDTWKLGIIQDDWRHALGVKAAEVPTALMRDRTGLFLAKSQWPGVSLRLCVTDIGSEISNRLFILPKLSFATASPLCKLSNCYCGRTLGCHLSDAAQGQRALSGVTYTWGLPRLFHIPFQSSMLQS